MSSIIALDASSEACSVTLRLANGETLTRVSEEPRAHAAKLLPFIDQLLSEAALSINEIDSIACAVGPGSFTGLRIALGVAQGLAFGSGQAIRPVCTLAAMAWHARACQPDEIIIPVLDARMAEVYWGAYSSKAQALGDSYVARVSRAEDFIREIKTLSESNTLVAVGDAWHQVDFAQSIAKELKLSIISPPASLSEAVVELAAASSVKLKPESVDLLYCRNSVAWDKRQRIRS